MMAGVFSGENILQNDSLQGFFSPRDLKKISTINLDKMFTQFLHNANVKDQDN